MNKARISPSATADLDEIWLYLAQHGGIEIAERHVEQLTSKFGLLATMPGLGRSRPELKPGVRSHAVGEYVIYYRYQKSRIIYSDLSAAAA